MDGISSWDKRLDSGYEWAKEAFLLFTKSGNIVSLLQPTQMGDGTTDHYFRSKGLSNPQRSIETNKAINYLTSSSRGVAIKDMRTTSLKVNSALLKLGLLSRSLQRFISMLDSILFNNVNATLAKKQRIVGVEQGNFVTLRDEDLAVARSNMIKYLGGRPTDLIMIGKDNEDQLLILSFLDILLVPRVSQDVKDTSPRRNARSGQLIFSRRNVRRRNKMANVDNSNVVSYADQAFGLWSSWRIDYAALNRLFKEETRTAASASELLEIMNKVAICVNAPSEAVQVVMVLESGWPTLYSTYNATMNRLDGSPKYRGVSQASKDFWTDVHGQFKGKGVGVPLVPERASLAMQIAAPFVYADRYRRTTIGKNKLTDWPLTPAVIYSFHQQSLNGLKHSFNPVKLIGNQSGVSVDVLRTAFRQHGDAGRRITL